MPPSTEPSPEVFRDLVDVARDAMIAVHADTGVIRLANARAEEVFGHPRERLVGRPLELVVPEPVPTGPPSERLARHADGHEFPVEVWLTPLAGGGDRLVAVTVRDASERHAFREASERMRDELIATVSHELRTPLTSILGCTELLVDMGEDAFSTHAARLLDVVRRNAQRELKLVEDMLALAIFGTSSLVLPAQPVDLAAVAVTVLDDLAELAHGAGVQLTAGWLEPLWVDGDAVRLGQVLSNLVTNAIKFTAPGGRVEVRLVVDGCHAVLEVEDQGMGVHPEELPRVFDRLYRSPDVVAAQLPGAGLGLPVVKGIVDAHAGEVDVQSQPGRGTRAQVRLPLARTELAGETA